MRVALLFVVVVVGACEKDKQRDSPRPTPRPTVDASAIDAGPVTPTLTKCGEVAIAICNAYERCKRDMWFLEFNDAANCRGEIERECKGWQLPGSSASDGALDTCAAKARDVACEDFHRTTPACALPVGTLQDGRACADQVQCAGGSCIPEEETGCWRCKHIGSMGTGPGPRGGSVEAACQRDIDCDEGLACVKQKCARPSLASEGEGCTRAFIGPGGSRPCRYGLECMDEGKGTACRARPREGDACTQSGPSCAYPARCVAGTCRSGVAHNADRCGD